MDPRKQLLEQAEQGYAELTAALAGLDEAAMREVWLGTWSARDIVAHVTGWHAEMMPALERLRRGEAPYAEGAYDDADGWNARFVDARRDRTTDQLLRELDRSHRELMDAAVRLPDSLVGEGAPASGLIDGVAGAHYREHAAQIRDWRG